MEPINITYRLMEGEIETNERETKELKEMPEIELNLLAQLYEKRGLKKETAMQVAKELSAKDALGAHMRDELGINENLPFRGYDIWNGFELSWLNLKISAHFSTVIRKMKITSQSVPFW